MLTKCVEKGRVGVVLTGSMVERSMSISLYTPMQSYHHAYLCNITLPLSNIILSPMKYVYISNFICITFIL